MKNIFQGNNLFSRVTSKDPTNSFSLGHLLFMFFCQSCSQTFSSILLCIPSWLPILRKLPASCLWLPSLAPHPRFLLSCQQPAAPASLESTRGSELEQVQPSTRGSSPTHRWADARHASHYPIILKLTPRKVRQGRCLYTEHK